MKRKEFFQTVAGAALGTALFSKMEAMHTSPVPRTQPWPAVEPNDEHFWKFVRQEFPLTEERVYFNTGGLGPSPYAVIDAVKAKMDELEKICETGHSDALLKDIKTKAGAFLGCDAEELAFVRNTTEGVDIVCNGLPLKKGDEIITTTHEHVGNAIPWEGLRKRTDIEIKFFVPSMTSIQENVDRIQKLITKRTRLISIPHATTTTGQIMPIKEISALAKSKNIWLFVDGAQTAGMFPFNLHEMGCDAYATSGHKWLVGPKETGFLYVRKDMLDVIEPKFIGAYSDNGFDYQKGILKFHPTAQRYEYGTINIPLRVGLGAAVDFLTRIGQENVWKHDQALANHLADGLSKIPSVKILSPSGEARSAMITFVHEQIPYLELQNKLGELKFRTRGVGEAGLNAMRISCHLYNSFEEVDRLLEGIRNAK
ncbi:MAG: aminotransferase class V-fold PLP-dependent enzyme [bacterium]